ncbi:hypothetical protein HerbRD11066_45220 [Herbidospora sp. RD11066]
MAGEAVALATVSPAVITAPTANVYMGPSRLMFRISWDCFLPQSETRRAAFVCGLMRTRLG